MRADGFLRCFQLLLCISSRRLRCRHILAGLFQLAIVRGHLLLQGIILLLQVVKLLGDLVELLELLIQLLQQNLFLRLRLRLGGLCSRRFDVVCVAPICACATTHVASSIPATIFLNICIRLLLRSCLVGMDEQAPCYGVMEIVALKAFVGSAIEVAVTCTVPPTGTVAGAT